MKTLSKVGWYCVGLALVLFLIVFSHYDGFASPSYALGRMLASAFWGGITLFALFTMIMAVLFLSA